MKVYIVDEGIDRMGGVERIVSVLSNKLSDTYNVKVISEFKNREQPFYDYKKNIEITYLLNKIDTYINKFNKKSLMFYFLKFVEKIARKFYLPIKIKKMINKVTSDDMLIFARVQVALEFLPFFEKKGINPKIIVRDAATIECLNNSQRKKLVYYFPKYVNHFIVSSSESVNNYKKTFGDTKIKIEKLYNPLGIEPKIKYAYEAKKIISIGRLHPQKGFVSLINAFDIVSSSNPNWILEIYGTGREEHKLKKLIYKKQLETKVFLKGSVKDVVSLLNSSSIFVLPSRYEGYANALVEAMSCGVPCISYNWISGAEEIISNNINGIIVDLENRIEYFNGNNNDNDEKKLAFALDKLMNDEILCNTFSCEASKIAESRNIDIIISCWLEIINNVNKGENINE